MEAKCLVREVRQFPPYRVKVQNVRKYISALMVSPLHNVKLSTGEILLYSFYNTVN